MVQIKRGEELDDGEHFSGQRWKRKQEQRFGHITITNITVKIEYYKKARRLGRRQRGNINGRCACLENGKQRRVRDRVREYTENKDRLVTLKRKRVKNALAVTKAVNYLGSRGWTWWRIK